MSGSLWLLQLQPASFRGRPFSVENNEIARGRRTAVHEYPFRDDVWVEDLGRGIRSGSFSGFIVGDTCYAQAAAMLAAAEKPGPGTLVHPSFGALSVSLTAPMRAIQRKELGRVVELQFEFVESAAKPQSPTSGLFAAIQSAVAAAAADVAVVTDFIGNVRTSIDQGILDLRIGVATVSSFVSTVVNVGQDAALIVSSVAGLEGNLGRYAAQVGVQGPGRITTAAQAISSVVASRASLAAAGANAVTLMGNLAITDTSDNGTCAAIQATTEALRTACIDPADAIRLLTGVAGYAPTVTNAIGPQGIAAVALQTSLGEICRRAALTSLSRACAAYQPTSYDDAVAVRAAVNAAMTAEMLIAADAEEDASYQALRALRAYVTQDLTQRGADLARLATLDLRQVLPSLAIAYRLYEDAARSDDLIARVNPAHPALMPSSFTALAT